MRKVYAEINVVSLDFSVIFLLDINTATPREFSCVNFIESRLPKGWGGSHVVELPKVAELNCVL